MVNVGRGQFESKPGEVKRAEPVPDEVIPKKKRKTDIVRPEEMQKELEKSSEKAGRVLDEFDREDNEGKKKVILRYATEADLDGIKNVEIDKWKYRGETYQDQFNARREWKQENTDTLREL